MARGMTDNELLALVGQYEKTALGASVSAGATVGGNISPAGQQMSTLEVDRYNALNSYFARPMGNEVADRSQVVIPELRDTIEWVMPQLMRMFAATQKACQFDPENEKDEEQAEVETDVVNHVFMKMNEGFFILHDMFKDALLLRNGYAKVYWDQERKTSVESYTGLTEPEVTQLMQNDDEVEVLGQSESVVHVQTPMGLVPVNVFDLRIRRTAMVGQVKVECIPPEEILISPKARDGFDGIPFAEHKTKVTRSTLKEMGFDADKIESISQGSPDWLNLVSLARDEVTDQLGEDNPTDKASQEVDLREVYLRVDFDGDGISELRRLMIGGDSLLENEECDEIPIAYCSPIRMPHRHVGISYYDILNDLQVIKTTLFRNGLDNLYATNNERTAINYRNVNIDDLLTTRPGGVIRVDGPPGENILPMGAQSNMMQQIIPAMDYVDSMREMRTGIGKDTMGVDADALQDVTKGGQLAAMSAAALKVELVARLLAEGVKDLFQKIHTCLLHHQDKPMTVNITGKWVDVNPAEWKSRTKVSINVGLGSGNREEARGNLAMLMSLQEKAAPFGIVGPKEAYETSKQGVHLLGYENPQMFFMDPDSPEYHQAQQQKQQMSQMNPDIMKIHIQGQIAQQTAQMKAQMDAQADARDAQLAQIQQQAQAQQNAQAQQLEAQRQAMQSHQQAQLQQLQMASDERMAQMQQSINVLIAQLNNRAKVEVAELGALTTLSGQQISAAQAATPDEGI